MSDVVARDGDARGGVDELGAHRAAVADAGELRVGDAQAQVHGKADRVRRRIDAGNFCVGDVQHRRRNDGGAGLVDAGEGGVDGASVDADRHELRVVEGERFHDDVAGERKGDGIAGRNDGEVVVGGRRGNLERRVADEVRKI